MPVTHYYTQNWIICSYPDLRKLLTFAVKEDGCVNELLRGQKVLLVESGLDMVDAKPKESTKNKVLLSMLLRLIAVSRKLDLDFVLVTNCKPEHLDKKFSVLIDEFKTW